MSKLRIGIAGYGWFGRIHHQAWLEVPGAEVVAIADPSGEARAATFDQKSAQDGFHQDTGSSAENEAVSQSVHRYPSAEAMLDAEKLDLVDVTAPEEHHGPLVLLALERGVGVSVEKPFVLTHAEARKVAREAEDRGGHVYVGHVLRFDARYQTVHERLATGGVVRHLSLQRHFQRSAHDVYGRTHPYFSALVHDIDLAVWLSRSRVVRVTGITRSFLERPTPDVAVGTLEMECGALAIIQNAWHLSPSCPYGFSFDTTILADGGTFCVRNEPDVHVWTRDHGVAAPELHFWPLVGGRRRGALVAELTHFAECVRRKIASPIMPLGDAVHAIAVAESLQRSAREGRTLDVPV
jgi:predicted dehydrogenase